MVDLYVLKTQVFNRLKSDGTHVLHSGIDLESELDLWTFITAGKSSLQYKMFLLTSS